MTFKISIKEILSIYCVYKLFFSGIDFMCLFCSSHCLKELMHGSSLNITIITRLHFPFVSVIIFTHSCCIFSPPAVLVFHFSQLKKVIKLLEAARGISS